MRTRDFLIRRISTWPNSRPCQWAVMLDLVADVFPEADLVGSGTSGSNATRKWKPSSAPLPTFTSNGLYYLPAHCTRATRGKMVPLWVVALCRGLVVPEGPGVAVVAQRVGHARAISGWIEKEFAGQLCAYFVFKARSFWADCSQFSHLARPCRWSFQPGT